MSNETHYLPKSCIVRESKTTSLRRVYDCSAKAPENISLNDCLYKGPSLVDKLGSIVFKFRTNNWAYNAELSKAFLRIGIQTQDRDYTQFLWSHSQQNCELPKTFWFKNVLFGSASSPYLLQAAFRCHLSKYDTTISNKLLHALYVDNIQSTTDSESELLDIYHDAHKLFLEASMPLQERRTDNPQLQAIIHPDYSHKQSETESKVLGTVWITELDTLHIKSSYVNTSMLQKRNALKLQ